MMFHANRYRRSASAHTPPPHFHPARGMERSNWKKRLNVVEAYLLAQQEMVYEEVGRLQEAMAGHLPDEWKKWQDAGVEWVLVDFPIRFLNIPLGLMKHKKVAEYEGYDQRKMPPVLLGFNGQIINGRHRVLAAFNRGDVTIRAYAPQKRGAPLDEFAVKSRRDVSAKGRYAQDRAGLV